VVAINDLGPVETNAHLLRYDSVHGRFPATVTVKGSAIDVGRGPMEVTAIKAPGRPALGRRRHRAGVHRHLHLEGEVPPHLENGSKRVLISAPAKARTRPSSTA
jgi:glyceraldehyde 3-phosphate dehydrogenase